jgi:hypothetical protein
VGRARPVQGRGDEFDDGVPAGNLRAAAPEDSVAGEHLAELGEILDVHQPEVTGLQLLDLLDVRQARHVHRTSY